MPHDDLFGFDRINAARRPARAARPPLSLRGQRLRRPHLRDRLVPAAAVGDRLVGRLPGRVARDVHGRHVPRELAPAEVRQRQRASAEGLCVPGTRHRGLRSLCAVWRAADRRLVRRVGPAGDARHLRTRHRRGDMSAAADAHDGRHAAGDVTVGRNDPAGRLLARLLLRRQHRRRRDRQPAGRLLSAAHVRHDDRDPRRDRLQHPRRVHRPVARGPHAA